MKHKVLFVILMCFMLMPVAKVKALDFCVIPVSEHSLKAHQDADCPMWDLVGMKNLLTVSSHVSSSPSVLSQRQCSVDGCWILKALQAKYFRSCPHVFFEKSFRFLNYVYFLDSLRL